jgi:NAD kinase
MKNILYKDEYGKEIIEFDNHITAIGGDGTLLRAISLFRDKNKKFFGVAGGTKNFLMNSSRRFSRNKKIKKFKLIKAKIFFKTADKLGNLITTIEEVQAFNDILIGGNMNSWINFDVEDKDKIIGNFNGGGVIISTPQGSTGINKNNGGVILPLSAHNWVITGDKTDKKINYVLEPRKIEIEMKSRQPVTLWVDGSNNIFENVEKVILSLGDTVEVIFNDYEKFETLRN